MGNSCSQEPKEAAPRPQVHNPQYTYAPPPQAYAPRPQQVRTHTPPPQTALSASHGSGLQNYSFRSQREGSQYLTPRYIPPQQDYRLQYQQPQFQGVPMAQSPEFSMLYDEDEAIARALSLSNAEELRRSQTPRVRSNSARRRRQEEEEQRAIMYMIRRQQQEELTRDRDAVDAAWGREDSLSIDVVMAMIEEQEHEEERQRTLSASVHRSSASNPPTTPPEASLSESAGSASSATHSTLDANTAALTHECSICLENFSSSESAFLPCMHGFHRPCIQAWVSSNLKRGTEVTCPTCMLVVREDIAHSLVR